MDKSTLDDIIGKQEADLATAESWEEEAPPTHEKGLVVGETRRDAMLDAKRGMPIPDGDAEDLVVKKLHEIIDDWRGWRILVGDKWEVIEYLYYVEGNQDVSIQVLGRVDAFDKDETEVRA